MYIYLNNNTITGSRRFHRPTCTFVERRWSTRTFYR